MAATPAPVARRDDGFSRRIMAAYAIAAREFAGHGDGFWQGINARSEDVHRLLLAGDAAPVSTALANPHTTDLTYGFDIINRTFLAEMPDVGPMLRDSLARLAQAVGAIPVQLPERPRPLPGTEELIAALDEKLGFRIDFPNPYPFEWGLATSRGIASWRPLMAIYQAWRLQQLAAGEPVRILEIGAGMGRTAYYARRIGLGDYTIIDLPLANVAQSHFLGSVLGPDAVQLTGEPRRPGAIAIYGPRFIEATAERFDIVLNANSLVEMDERIAAGYVAFAARQARLFLSINHEHWRHRSFRTLATPHAVLPIPRFHYWMHDGWVEEVATFDRRLTSRSAAFGHWLRLLRKKRQRGR